MTLRWTYGEGKTLVSREQLWPFIPMVQWHWRGHCHPGYSPMVPRQTQSYVLFEDIYDWLCTIGDYPWVTTTPSATVTHMQTVWSNCYRKSYKIDVKLVMISTSWEIILLDTSVLEKTNGGNRRRDCICCHGQGQISQDILHCENSSLTSKHYVWITVYQHRDTLPYVQEYLKQMYVNVKHVHK